MCDLLTNVTIDDFNKFVLALVALIAVFLGPFLQWKIARRQIMTQEQIAKRQAADNISAKRQVWIDELRKDTSEFLTLFACLEDLRRPGMNLSSEDRRRNFEDMAAASAKSTELGIRIKLRLNPTEGEHNRFVDLLRALSDVCVDPPANETIDQQRASRLAFNQARDRVIAHLQTILKHEWERVKRGD